MTMAIECSSILPCPPPASGVMIRRYATVRVWKVFPPKEKRNPLGTNSFWVGTVFWVVTRQSVGPEDVDALDSSWRIRAVRGADRRHIATGETARRENCERTEFLPLHAYASSTKRLVERNARNTRGSVTLPESSE